MKAFDVAWGGVRAVVVESRLDDAKRLAKEYGQRAGLGNVTRLAERPPAAGVRPGRAVWVRRQRRRDVRWDPPVAPGIYREIWKFDALTWERMDGGP